MGAAAIKADFPCRLCAGTDLFLYHTMGNDGRYRYFKCPRCKLVNYDLSTGLTQDQFETPDTDPTDDTERSHWNKNQAFAFLSGYLSPPGNLLDVGCSTGRLLFLARAAGWEVKGLELSEVMAQVVRDRLGEEVIVADFLEVEPESIGAGEFDVICMQHVLEHLPDCLLAMKKLSALLKPGGHILIEVPNVESVSKKVKRFLTRTGLRKPVFPEDIAIGHANEFCRESFQHLLDKTGFELCHWHNYSRKPAANFFYKHVHVGSNARALIRKKAN